MDKYSDFYTMDKHGKKMAMYSYRPIDISSLLISQDNQIILPYLTLVFIFQHLGNILDRNTNTKLSFSLIH